MIKKLWSYRILYFSVLLIFILAGTLTLLNYSGVSAGDVVYTEDFSSLTETDTDYTEGNVQLTKPYWLSATDATDPAIVNSASTWRNQEMVTDSNGYAWMIAEDTITSAVYLTRWNGTEWTQANGVDDGYETIIANGAWDSRILIDGSDNIYVFWMDGTDLNVKQWSGAAWGNLGTGVSVNLQLTLAGTPVSYEVEIDGSDNPNILFQLMGVDSGLYFTKWSGVAWVDANDVAGKDTMAGAGAGTGQLSLDGSDNPFVSWYDNIGGNVYFTKWDGGGDDRWEGMDNVAGNQTVDNVNAGSVYGLELTTAGMPHITWQKTTSLYETHWDSVDGRFEKMDTTAGIDTIVLPHANVQNVSLTLDTTDLPYLMWESDNNGDTFHEKVYLTHWDSAQWGTMGGVAGNEELSALDGSGLKQYQNSELAIHGVNNKPIIFLANSTGDQIYYSYWNGSNWVEADGITAGLDDLNSSTGSTGDLYLDSNNITHIVFSLSGQPYYTKYSANYKSSGTSQVAADIVSGDGYVVAGTLTATADATGGTIVYQLSTNNGLSWDTVTSGTAFNFLSRGDELLWKTTITSTDGSATPTISAITVDYTLDEAPGTPTLITPADEATSVSATPSLTFSSSDADSDKLRYVLQFSTNSSFGSTLYTFDQTKDNLGWDASWYSAGDTATFTLPADNALSPEIVYYWRAKAVDVYGNHSAYSSANEFTVATGATYDYIEYFHDIGKIDTTNTDVDYSLAGNNSIALPTKNTFAAASAKFGLGRTTDVDVFDADNDGDLDVLVMNYGANESFNSNDGDGTWTTTAGQCGVSEAVPYDADNDGDIDYAAYNLASKIVICINNGAGVFTETGSFTASGSVEDQLEGGDFNNDGYLDITDGRYILLNDKTNTLTTAVDTFGADNDGHFEVFDVDNDGDDDFVIGNTGGSLLTVYKNDGSGVFTSSTSVIGGGDNPRTTAIDVENDGDIDLIITANNAGEDYMYLELNDGTGTFIHSSLDADLDCEADSLYTADVDGDGMQDVLCGGTGDTNYIYRNIEFGDFSEEEISADSNDTEVILAADVDNDGDMDVIVGNDSGGNEQNYLYSVSAANSLSGTALAAGEQVLAVFDSDNDGDSDLYVNNSGGVNELWINDGSQSYTQSAVFGNVSDVSVGLVDYDNDGDLDVIEAVVGGQNTLYTNNGSNSFSTGSFGSGTLDTYDVKTADFNNDGYLDVVFGNVGAANELWLSASGVFASAEVNPFGATADNTYGFDVGDIDNDGDMDLVFPDTDNANSARIFTNNGSAVFTASDAFLTDTKVIRLGDLDGDGDLDAVIIDDDTGDTNNFIYYNNGQGVFTQLANLAGADSYDIDLVDLDNDYDLDIVIAMGSSVAEKNIIYRNYGELVFSKELLSDIDQTASIAVGDYDSDGDMDVYANNSTGESKRWDRVQTFTIATDYTVQSTDLYAGATDLSYVTLNKTDYTPTNTTIAYYVQDTLNPSYTFAQEDTSGRAVDMNTGEVGGVSFVLGDAGNNAIKVGGIWGDLSVSEGVSDLMDYWSGDVGETTYIISVGSGGYFTAVSSDLGTQEPLCGGVVDVTVDLTEMAIETTNEFIIYASGSGGVGVKVDLEPADTDNDITKATCEIVGFGGAATANNLNGVWQSEDGTAIFFVGDGGTMIASDDSGASWGTISTGTAQNLNHIEMSNGWFTAVGDSGTIIKSADGTTWSSVTSCSTSENLNWIRNESATRFLAVGDNDTYAHTENGGTTCTVSTTGVAGATHLNSIDDDELYVFGDNDKILNFTYDAGSASFVSVTPGTQYDYITATTTLIWKAVMSTTDANASPRLDIANFLYTIKSPVRRIVPSDIFLQPNAPVGLQGVALSDSSIQWTWGHGDKGKYINGKKLLLGFKFYNDLLDGESSLLEELSDVTEKTEVDLVPNTSYRRKVYAYNEKGSSNLPSQLATDNSVYTLAAKPNLSSIQKNSASSAIINLDANSNPDYTKCAIYESTTSQWVQADGTLGDEKVSLSFSDWGSSVEVQGLEVLVGMSGFTMSAEGESTTYSFMAVAENEDGAETDFSTPVDVEITGEVVEGAVLSINKTVSLYNPEYAFNFAKSASASGVSSGDKLLKAVDNSIKFTNGALWTIFGILFLFVMLIMANATGTIKQKIKQLHKILFKNHKQEDSHDVYQVINNTNEPFHNNRYYRHHTYSRVTGVVMVGFVVGILIKLLLGGFLTFLVYSDIGSREFVEAADANVEVGNVLQYRVDYSNAEGAGDAVNLVVEDAIPANTEYKAGTVVTSLGEVVGNPGASGVVQVEVDSLSPGQSGYVTFNVEILESASVGVSILNQSKIKDDNSAYIFSNTTSNTVVATLSCGDDICSDGESCSTCSDDCGSCQEESCGNGICSDVAGENCDSCQSDCGACQEETVCGDAVCSDSETCSSCSTDCGECAESCGNGRCFGDESCSSCQSDCGVCEEAVTCGDGVCTSGEESCSSCQSDCGVCIEPFCGDGFCRADLAETCSSCTSDCGECEQPYCGDGSCSKSESCSTCATDCNECSEVEICGNGICSSENGEDVTNCSSDCGNLETNIYCGDNLCDASEACGTCSADCGVCSEPNCGDGICSANEDNLSCGMDCGGYEIEGYYCGDSVCQETEQCFTCSADCGACSEAHCGDGECTEGEDYLGCFSDCGGLEVGEYCGDSVCSDSESCSSCQSDCGDCKVEYCGNGICSIEIGENISSCSQDCGSLETDNFCGDLVCSDNESCLTCASDCGDCDKQCSDNSDNDDDGYIDYPFDSECTNYLDNNEWPELEATVPACIDEIDNDNDGLVDYPDDPGCSDYLDNNETNFQEIIIIDTDTDIEELEEILEEEGIDDSVIDDVIEEIIDNDLIDDIEDIMEEIGEEVGDDETLTEDELEEIIEEEIEGTEDINDIVDILVETEISDEEISDIIDLIIDLDEGDLEDIAEEFEEEILDDDNLTGDEAEEIIEDVIENVEDINDIIETLEEEADMDDLEIAVVIEELIEQDLGDDILEDIDEELLEEAGDAVDPLTEEEVEEIINDVINDVEDEVDLTELLEEETDLTDDEIQDILDEIEENDVTDDEYEEIIENIEDALEDDVLTDEELDDSVDDVTGDLDPEDVVDAIEDLTDEDLTDDQSDEIIDEIIENDLSDDDIADIIEEIEEEFENIDIDELTDEEIDEIIGDIIDEVIADEEDLNDIEDAIDGDDSFTDDDVEDAMDEIIEDLTDDQLEDIFDAIDDEIVGDGDITPDELVDIIDEVVDEATDMTNDRDTRIIYNTIDEQDEWDKSEGERIFEIVYETEEIMNSPVVVGTTKVVAKVVSRVSDISYRDAKKAVGKVLRVNVKFGKDIEKGTIDNPVIEKVNDVTREGAIATITVGAGASLATVGTTGAAGIGTLLQYLFTQPLFVLFSARRKKKWGTIYNSVTKKPVDLAIVRVYNSETKRLIRTQVTDKQGRYQFILKPGKYYMEVFKKEFKFPSKIASHSVDGDLESIYHGGEFEIAENDTSVVFGIALDPLKSDVSDVKMIKLFIMRRWQSGIVIIGPVLAIVSFIVNPQIWVGGLALAHLGSYLIFKRVAVNARPDSFGVVTDVKTNKNLGHAVVRVFDTQYNKLLDSKVTDRFGRYAFLVGNEQYFITCDKPGYFPLRSQRYDLSNELSGYLAEDISMQPHGFEDIEQAQKHNQPLTLRVEAGRQSESDVEGKKVATRRHAEKFTGKIEGVDLGEMHEDYYDVDAIDSDANDANKHANDANDVNEGMEHGTRNTEHGARNTEHGARNTEQQLESEESSFDSAQDEAQDEEINKDKV